MPILSAFRRSLELLNKKDHRTLYFAMGTQIVISLFDTVGVLLIGLITYIATATSKGSNLPASVEKALNLLGLENTSGNNLLGTLGAIALVMFIVRSFLAPLLLRRILKFLTGRSAQIPAKLPRFFSVSHLKKCTGKQVNELLLH